MPRLFRFAESFGLRDDRLVLERLRKVFGDARIEAMRIPLHLSAADFATGEQVVFSKALGCSRRRCQA